MNNSLSFLFLILKNCYWQRQVGKHKEKVNQALFGKGQEILYEYSTDPCHAGTQFLRPFQKERPLNYALYHSEQSLCHLQISFMDIYVQHVCLVLKEVRNGH